MRVASKVGNLRSKCGHSRPLGYQCIRYVRDGRTDVRTDGQKQRLLPLSLRVRWGHNNNNNDDDNSNNSNNNKLCWSRLFQIIDAMAHQKSCCSLNNRPNNYQTDVLTAMAYESSRSCSRSQFHM